MQDFKLIVNGTETTVSADPSASLLSVLREQLHLTGAKYACGDACISHRDGNQLPALTPRAIQ